MDPIKAPPGRSAKSSNPLHGHGSVKYNLQPQVKGFRSTIELSLSSASDKRPRNLFRSAIQSVAAWQSLYSPNEIPEETTDIYELAANNGYAESYRVAEILLSMAIPPKSHSDSNGSSTCSAIEEWSCLQDSRGVIPHL